MADSIDLNILVRGVQGQAWTAEKGVITAGDLDKVVEQKTNNSGALNALPTPFARFFIFNEAFRRMKEEKLNHRQEAGLAYERLVSDCLDVYELLFYSKIVNNDKINIVIKEWNKKKELSRLKEKTKILGGSLESYFSDLGNIDKLFFVVLETNGKSYLLGTSSPYTGFITPPDLDKVGPANEPSFIGGRYKEMPNLHRKDKGYYFKTILPFEQRTPEFKNYLYKTIFGKTVNDSFKQIRDYIRCFKDDPEIRDDFSSTLKPVLTEEKDALNINGIELSFIDNLEVESFFMDEIIKLPFRISRDNYISPTFINVKEQDYDYLLPLSEEAIASTDFSNGIDSTFKEGRDNITVTIKVNGREYSKRYTASALGEHGDGAIIDLGKYKKNLDLALFPNALSPDKQQNNYFKVMIAANDEEIRHRFSTNNIKLLFYKNINGQNELINEGTSDAFDYGVKPVVIRSVQKDDNPCSTAFYEVFNSHFDVMRLGVTIDDRTYYGTLIPNWYHAKKSQKIYTYSIDLGTSNTFVSRRESGESTTPEQLVMEKPIMSYLHDKQNSTQLKPMDRWEKIAFDKGIKAFQAEFLPPYFDSEKYSFPIRTAVCKTDMAGKLPELFDNRNIAFYYEKKKMPSGYEILTDLKWTEDNLINIRLFVRELLLIIKSDLLQEDGNIDQTRIVWFRPLSFPNKIKNAFEEIWTEESTKILGISSDKIECYTESEAPYYYFNEKNTFNSIDSVAVVDIGGGSTDLMYFEKSAPKLANSVHFGCDVLWGNGHNKLDDDKQNGVYLKYKDIIKFTDEELQSINQDMQLKERKVSTKDIINFWINNDNDIKFTSKLQNDFKPLFLYHYVSLIYYIATMIKVKDLPCPRAITFSGNGSRYIDKYLTKDVDVLTDLTMIVLNDVFGSDIRRIQIILPEDRKESTSYGGLYIKPGNKAKDVEFFYTGVDNNTFEKVAQLEKAYKEGNLREGLINQYSKMNALFEEMLSSLILKEHLENIKTPIIKKSINEGIEDALDKEFQKEVVELGPESNFRDSLFFLPIIDQLFKLGKVLSK